MAVNMNRLAAPPFGLMGALSRQSYILQGQENGFPDRRNQNGSGAGGVGHNIQVMYYAQIYGIFFTHAITQVRALLSHLTTHLGAIAGSVTKQGARTPRISR